jgi:multiple sugar transport system ATP-binding protein
MAQVAFNNVSKVYGDGTRAVNALDLQIEDGEFMVFVGPSGCGKTSALRMVGGLEAISDGELMIGERVANDLGPKERDVAMVFQNYALYPHMSVFDNIAFPLRAQGVASAEIKERVPRIAKQLALDEHLKRRPRNLSGGQRQRVAMGRALVREPQVFLMDEPLSNLDAKLRVEMRGELTRLQREVGVTTIYVTHDQVEAMTMGDRIAVMRKGVLEQQGSPQTLYNEPANLFVAQFIGSPAMNLFRATLDRADGRLILVLGDQKLALPDRPQLAGQREVATAPAELPRLRAEVTLVETLGPERLVHVTLNARPVVTADVLDVVRDMDASMASELSEHAGETTSRAIARFEADAAVAAGEVRELAVVPEKLRFFDLETGTAIA